VFLDYHDRKEVFGLFLSSGVIGTPDATMERLNATARILRGKHRFKGYIHLKVIPGASDAAIDEAVSLASAVSLNIETPGAAHLARLSSRKDYLRDIIRPIKRISELTAQGSRFAKVKQTTQFFVGPAGESDAEIVKSCGALRPAPDAPHLLQRLSEGAGRSTLSAESAEGQGPPHVRRSLHARASLYQVDFLMRKYGFTDADIPYDNGGYPPGDRPEEGWPPGIRFLPVHVNQASQRELLRVPVLGPVTVQRISNFAGPSACRARTARAGRRQAGKGASISCVLRFIIAIDGALSYNSQAEPAEQGVWLLVSIAVCGR
jgi:predicted DNA-binding helix-hairpin-helix protein